MGEVIKQNGEVITSVVRVVDTADGYIRIERSGGSVSFLEKADVAEINAPTNFDSVNPITKLKRKLDERKRRTTEQQELADQEEVALITRELLHISQNPDQCHSCGGNHLLVRYPFGLAKILSSKRNWSPSLQSIAVSTALAAVFLPIAGKSIVGFALPGKKESARILRLFLVLCDECHAKQKSIYKRAGMRSIWQLHPWWNKAMQCGYTEFLSDDELEQWKPLQQ
jgi:hypothetical protein